MAEVRPFHESLFGEVYEKYLKDDDPLLHENDWRRVFQYSADLTEPVGYVLADQGRIVGILGTLFSNRQHHGRTFRYCNLHSWKVDEAYRGSSLFLIRPVLMRRDVTLTDFSPTPHVVQISRRLGFSSLDSRLIVLPARGWPGRLKRSLECELIFDNDEIVSCLSEADRKLFDAHQDSHLRHCLVKAGANQCYLIYSRVERWRLPYCYIHYLSNTPLFVERLSALRYELAGRCGVRFSVVDARCVTPVNLPSSLIVPVSSWQMCRPATDGAGPIDTLFSEVSLLNLSTFPSMRGVWRGMVNRLSLARQA